MYKFHRHWRSVNRRRSTKVSRLPASLPAARDRQFGRAAKIPTGPKHTHTHTHTHHSPHNSLLSASANNDNSSSSQAIFIFNYVVSERQKKKEKKVNCGMHNVPGSQENWATLRTLLQLGGHRRRIETATCRNANEFICRNVKRFASIEYLVRACNQS